LMPVSIPKRSCMRRNSQQRRWFCVIRVLACSWFWTRPLSCPMSSYIWRAVMLFTWLDTSPMPPAAPPPACLLASACATCPRSARRAMDGPALLLSRLPCAWSTVSSRPFIS